MADDREPYYCPYCNRHRRNVKKTPEERTVEHVIPQAIGGSSMWAIKVCQECNNSASGRCDGIFANYADFYAYAAYQPFTRDGIATLMDGSEVKARFKLRVNRNNTIMWHHGCRLDSKEPLKRRQVSHVTFRYGTPTSAQDAVIAIAPKIALGAIYLLLQSAGLWDDFVHAVGDVKLFTLRRYVAAHAYTDGGLPGSLRIRAPGADELPAWLREFGEPTGPEHRVTLLADGVKMRVRFGLFSQLFAEVETDCPGFVAGPFERSQPLSQLLPTPAGGAGWRSHANGPIFCFVLTDKGQPIKPADLGA